MGLPALVIFCPVIGDALVRFARAGPTPMLATPARIVIPQLSRVCD
jgi:hypothetical protein